MEFKNKTGFENFKNEKCKQLKANHETNDKKLIETLKDFKNNKSTPKVSNRKIENGNRVYFKAKCNSVLNSPKSDKKMK